MCMQWHVSTHREIVRIAFRLFPAFTGAKANLRIPRRDPTLKVGRTFRLSDGFRCVFPFAQTDFLIATISSFRADWLSRILAFQLSRGPGCGRALGLQILTQGLASDALARVGSFVAPSTTSLVAQLQCYQWCSSALASGVALASSVIGGLRTSSQLNQPSSRPSTITI
jgi:hypothetical protein